MPGWSQSLQGIKGDLRQGGAVVVRFVNDKGAVGDYPHTLLVYEEGAAFGWSDPIISGLRDHHIYRVVGTQDGNTLFTQDDSANGFMSLFAGGYVMKFMMRTYPVFNEGLRVRAEAAVAVMGEGEP